MSASPPPPAADLESLRGRIDAIDRELLGLLNRRADVATAIGALKRAEGSPAFRPEREAAVIDALGSEQRPWLTRASRRSGADHVGAARSRRQRSPTRAGGHVQRAARSATSARRSFARRARTRTRPDQRRRRPACAGRELSWGVVTRRSACLTTP
jgi:hypothetical protein